MAIYCISCGTQLPDSASFCLKCGTPLKDATTLAVQRSGLGRETHEQETGGSSYSIVSTDYQQKNSILYPRILFALCVVLIAVPLWIGLSNTPADGTPLVVVNPTLAHTLAVIAIVGLVLLFIVWVWCLYLTYQRNQSGWRAALWLSFFSAAIPVLLYVLINPQAMPDI